MKNKRKLKVLVCAYACQPGGSLKWVGPGELILGWNIINQLSRFHRVLVLTHPQNRLSIDVALKKKPLPNYEILYTI